MANINTQVNDAIRFMYQQKESRPSWVSDRSLLGFWYIIGPKTFADQEDISKISELFSKDPIAHKLLNRMMEKELESEKIVVHIVPEHRMTDMLRSKATATMIMQKVKNHTLSSKDLFAFKTMPLFIDDDTWYFDKEFVVDPKSFVVAVIGRSKSNPKYLHVWITDTLAQS